MSSARTGRWPGLLHISWNTTRVCAEGKGTSPQWRSSDGLQPDRLSLCSRRNGYIGEAVIELLDLLAPQLDQQLRQCKEEDSFIELLRHAIQDRLTGQRPSMDVISEALHMSSRTLQRRLQESGSSFQRVLDEARHQMARYYLSNSVLELNDAAYLLGFEDPNSFGRALRTWEGVPPSDWRETHRSSAPN